MAYLRYLTLSLFGAVAFASPQSVTQTLSTQTEQPYNFGDGGGTASTYTPSSYTSPSGSTLHITYPGGLWNTQAPVVGSLIGTANSLTTVAVTCPDYVTGFDCPFLNPATLTVGASTLHYVPEVGITYTITRDCTFSTGGGTCYATSTGPAALFGTLTASSDIATITGQASSTSTTIYAASEITTINVIITNSGVAGTASASSTATAPRVTTAPVSSGSSARMSSSSSSMLMSTAINGANAYTPDVHVAAGLIGGLAALLL